MNRGIAGSLLSFVSGIALAQSGIEDPHVNLEDWLVTESMKMAETRRVEQNEFGISAPGTLRIVPLSEFSAPVSIKEDIANGARNRAEGPIAAAPGTIPSLSAIVSSLKGDGSTRSNIVTHPTFEPTDLSLTPLGHGQLIATHIAGVVNGDGSHTGLARYFFVPAIGVVEFSEDDYVAAGTTITLVAESLNVEVNGVPAMSWTAQSPEGPGKATLSWVTQSRAFRLVLITDDSNILEVAEGFLMDIATGIPQ